MCSKAGERIVAMVQEDLKPRDICAEASFHNAVKTVLAIGGSTNACVHLPAWRGASASKKAAAFGVEQYNREIPVLANLMPAGTALMEDFFFAGGLPALLKQIAPHLDTSCRNITGGTLGDVISNAEIFNADIIRPLDNAGIEGSYRRCNGQSGAAWRVSRKRPPHRPTCSKVGLPSCSRTLPTCRRVLTRPISTSARLGTGTEERQTGRRAGHARAGNLPIPEEAAGTGCARHGAPFDARMSGTHYGTCVLCQVRRGRSRWPWCEMAI